MPIGKRKRTASDSFALEVKKGTFEELNSKVESLQKMIEEKLKNILDKLGNSDESETEEKPSFNSVISPGSLIKNVRLIHKIDECFHLECVFKTNPCCEPANTGVSPIGRSFVLKHTFKSVSEFEEGKDHFSGNEDHFGVSWRLSILKKDQHLQTFLWCRKSLEVGHWAINIKFAPRVIGTDGKITTREFSGVFGNDDGNKTVDALGKSKFIAWEELEKEYLVDDKFDMEIHVEILEMSGVYKENLRCFNETKKNHSDVVLKVNSQKFYVAKLFLASHSPYFDSLFLGPYLESNQSEIELTGICPEDFQNYLEVLYGDPAIDDTTVEGILLVADMYDTSIVIGKCEGYLIEKSQKSLKKKLQVAIRYNLDYLKKQLIANMKTHAEIRSVIPENPDDLDHATMAELLNKSLSLRYT